jgi:hypothetical protein
MDTGAQFIFPAIAFRHVETPFHAQGYRNYYAIVNVADLPDLSGWRKINVRDPKLTGAVPKAIRKSVTENPELFVFMNRGIVLSVEGVTYDNKTSKVTVVLRDPNIHGLLDGGHTYNILLEERTSLPHPQYVKLELLEGFRQEEIPNLVDARNTSNQVRDQSLMNLQGEFDKLKRAIARRPYASLIAYKEHEVLDDGSAKPIDVREVIAILTCFDRANFDDRVHPINAYRSKAAMLQHFSEHKKDYEKIYPLANDILELYDHVQLLLPDLYNKVRAKGGDVAGGKFGRLTGVTTYNGKRRAELLFVGKESRYVVPAGFVYPVLAAFRALLEEKEGRYVWGNSLDPLRLLNGQLGETLADTIGNFALDARNPSKTGKSPLVWQACYQAAQVTYLSNISRNQKKLDTAGAGTSTDTTTEPVEGGTSITTKRQILRPRRSRRKKKHAAPRIPAGSLLPEDEFILPLLHALSVRGGTAPAREIIEAVGERLRDRLSTADKDSLPSGDIRWKKRVQFVRLRLVEEGLLAKDSLRGLWALTAAGQARIADVSSGR